MTLLKRPDGARRTRTATLGNAARRSPLVELRARGGAGAAIPAGGRHASNRGREVRRVVAVQGGYYVATGVLPFVSRPLFEAMTGPKRDWWLVETVGGLVTVVGAALLAGAARSEPSGELKVVGLGTAVVLAGIDIAYVVNGRIAPTYLIDAGTQLGILAAFGVASSQLSH
jgi:hypothetical protein